MMVGSGRGKGGAVQEDVASGVLSPREDLQQSQSELRGACGCRGNVKKKGDDIPRRFLDAGGERGAFKSHRETSITST